MAKMPNQLPIVGAYDNSSSFLIYFPEQAHDFKSKLWIKVSGWLVSQNNFRAVYNRPGNSHSLLLTIR